MKIRSQLTLVILTLVASSILINGVIYYFSARQSIENRVVAQLQSINVLKENQFKDFIKRRIDDVEGVADRAKTEADYRKFLVERLRYETDFTEFFVIDLDGRVSMSTDVSQEGKFKSSESYFTKGKGGSYVQYFYYDLSLQTSATTLSTPIKDAKGNVIGVLAARLDLSKVSEFMVERSGLGETGETYFVNSLNMAVTDLLKEKGAALRVLVNTQGVTNCVGGNSGFAEYNDYKNDPVIGYYTWLPDSGLCLIAEIDQKEAFLPFQELALVILLVGLGIVVLTMFVSLFLSKRITGPIVALRNAVMETKKGKLTTHIDIKTKNEVGELANAFNEMAKHVSDYTGDLEREVQERTAELEKAKTSLEQGVQERTTELEKTKKELEATVEERTKKLNEKLAEAEEMNKLMVGRELKMVELKKEIAEYKAKSSSV